MEPNGEEGFVVKVGREVAGYVTPDADSPGLWVTEDQDRQLLGRVYDPEKGVFGPGMWCDGSSLKRSGSFVQVWQMNS
ncbi:hypothetical protein MSPGM_34910 [Methylorubrum sp. GM97]|nr:hypothetical protein MSPGM_34910 [Methylorubrum sp. GM97]